MGSPARMMRASLTAGLIAVFTLAGCGKPDDHFVPVMGKVTYKSQPLETGVVILVADTARGNSTLHEPHGSIDKDGSYRMMTAGKTGAPPGWYKVKISANKPQDPKRPYAPPVPIIPTSYGDVSSSGLTVEVVEPPGTGKYDFELK